MKWRPNKMTAKYWEFTCCCRGCSLSGCCWGLLLVLGVEAPPGRRSSWLGVSEELGLRTEPPVPQAGDGESQTCLQGLWLGKTQNIYSFPCLDNLIYFGSCWIHLNMEGFGRFYKQLNVSKKICEDWCQFQKSWCLFIWKSAPSLSSQNSLHEQTAEQAYLKPES